MLYDVRDNYVLLCYISFNIIILFCFIMLLTCLNTPYTIRDFGFLPAVYIFRGCRY